MPLKVAKAHSCLFSAPTSPTSEECMESNEIFSQAFDITVTQWNYMSCYSQNVDKVANLNCNRLKFVLFEILDYSTFQENLNKFEIQYWNKTVFKTRIQNKLQLANVENQCNFFMYSFIKMINWRFDKILLYIFDMLLLAANLVFLP